MNSKSSGHNAPRKYQLLAGHAVLDFVNTLDWRFRDSGPEELLPDFRSLVEFSDQAKLLNPEHSKLLSNEPDSSATRKTLLVARELRESLADVLYSVVDGHQPSEKALQFLESCFKQALGKRSLVWEGSQSVLVWTHSTMESEMPVSILALSAHDFLLSHSVKQVRACGDPTCRWLFLDTSRNHSRRWCDMKICGNRMKARRFKAQHHGDESR